MAHQSSRRLGWQSRNLARSLLYKFAFLAEPVQVADDVGVDFFCTLFTLVVDRTNASLMSKSSFAIQVKSKRRSDKTDLVNRLKLIKRQMYGRASLDLLRQRVLAA